MENPIAFQQHYTDHQRQMTWINTNGWQFERPEKRYRARTAVAAACIHLATLLTSTRQKPSLLAITAVAAPLIVEERVSCVP